MNQIPEIELQSPDKIRRFQEEQLKKLLTYVSAHSPFYKRHFASHGIDTDAIRSLEDLATIPPTTKDLFHEFNWDFLCVPRKKIVEYTSTSGTLGKPVTIALTDDDVKRLAYNEFISFTCADGTPEDIYQLMLTLDRQFMAGIAYYEGIRKLGAGLVRVGHGLPAMQLETIQRLKPTILVAVPSFIVKLIEIARLQGIDLNDSSVKRIVCIGESLRTNDFELNTLGRKIMDSWNVKLYSTYASTEMQTAFTECGQGKGGHLHPELLYVELLNENGLPVKTGEAGEVTVTTFGIAGMPLIRYKTGDIASAFIEPCGCGRTTTRLGPVIGRKQQMIKLRGTSLYPQGIFEVLQQTDHVQDYVVEVFTGSLNTDEVKLYVLTAKDLVTQVEAKLKSAFQSRLRIIPEIVFSTPSEIKLRQSGMRKTRKFIDSRTT